VKLRYSVGGVIIACVINALPCNKCVIMSMTCQNGILAFRMASGRIGMDLCNAANAWLPIDTLLEVGGFGTD
jgi:hypothetical protein